MSAWLRAALIATYDPSEGTLTVIHAHQSPFQMQDVFSRHLHIPEHKVRCISPDVGGAFGPLSHTAYLLFNVVPDPGAAKLKLAAGIKLTPRHYAYLKISEGCNNKCSFCIIPFGRGNSRSVPMGAVVTEARRKGAPVPYSSRQDRSKRAR